MPEREPQSKKDIDAEPRQEVWDYKTLKRFIAASCEAEKLGSCEFEKLPRQIDLGKFADKANLLRQKTDEDPRHREFAAKIIWHPGRKIIMTSRDEAIVEGDEDKVGIDPKNIPITDHESIQADTIAHFKLDEITDFREFTPELKEQVAEYVKNKKVTRKIGVIHSHPHSGPFSLYDVSHVLMDPKLKLAMVSGPDGIRAIVTTRKTEFPLADDLRGVPGKPGVAEKAAQLMEENIRKWEARIRQSMTARLDRDPALKERFYSDRKFQEKQLEQQAEALFAHIAQEEGFGYYKGDHSGIVRRLVPKKK